MLVEGAGTLKRVHVGRRRGELRPDNARFSPIQLKPDADIRIYGKFVALLRGGIRVQ